MVAAQEPSLASATRSILTAYTYPNERRADSSSDEEARTKSPAVTIRAADSEFPTSGHAVKQH